MSEATKEAIQKAFEGQLETRQAPDENRDKSAAIIDRLQQRLETLIVEGDSESSKERLQLKEDINIVKQLQELRKAAVPSQVKIHIFGETIADDNSDLVALTTVADLLNIKGASAKKHSMNTTGSTTSEDFQRLIEKRYTGRSEALGADSSPTEAGANLSPSATQTSRSVDIRQPSTISSEHSQGLATIRVKTSSNERKKRSTKDNVEN
jgi:hypothetical protein